MKSRITGPPSLTWGSCLVMVQKRSHENVDALGLWHHIFQITLTSGMCSSKSYIDPVFVMVTRKLKPRSKGWTLLNDLVNSWEVWLRWLFSLPQHCNQSHQWWKGTYLVWKPAKVNFLLCATSAHPIHQSHRGTEFDANKGQVMRGYRFEVERTIASTLENILDIMGILLRYEAQ